MSSRKSPVPKEGKREVIKAVRKSYSEGLLILKEIAELHSCSPAFIHNHTRDLCAARTKLTKIITVDVPCGHPEYKPKYFKAYKKQAWTKAKQRERHEAYTKSRRLKTGAVKRPYPARKNLTEEEKKDLRRDYVNGDSVKTLLKKHHIKNAMTIYYHIKDLPKRLEIYNEKAN